jgi:hypothetical protein
MRFLLPSRILFSQFLAFISTKMQLSFIVILAAISSSSFAAPLPGQGMSKIQDSTKHASGAKAGITHTSHANALANHALAQQLNAAQTHAGMAMETLKQLNAHAVQSIRRRSPLHGESLSQTHAATVHELAHAAQAQHSNALLTGAHVLAQLSKHGHDHAAQAIGRRSPSPGQGMSKIQDSTKHALAQHAKAQQINAAITHAQMHAELMKQANADAVQAIGRRRSDEDISLERRRTVPSAYIPVNYPV